MLNKLLFKQLARCCENNIHVTHRNRHFACDQKFIVIRQQIQTLNLHVNELVQYTDKQLQMDKNKKNSKTTTNVLDDIITSGHFHCSPMTLLYEFVLVVLAISCKVHTHTH